MGGEWTSTTLGAICSFATGSAFPKSAQGDMVGKYPFIKVSDMNLPGNDRFITIANNWVSKETQARLRAKVHPEGSTVFAKIGVALTYNRRRILTQPALIDNNMMAAIPIAGLVDHLFFYYMLCTIDFNEVAVGTALPYLNISDLSRITVRLPSLKDQQAIACILGTLDDKIELNRRMNQTLEDIARAIFKSWFINFDPVRAKAAVRRAYPNWTNAQISRAACPNLKPEIAELFPDSFEDSELGEIPKGWRVGHVVDLAYVSSGKRPEARYTDPSPESSVPLWGGNGPMGFVPEPLTTEPILLTGRVGTLGSVFRISTPCWPSDNTLIIRAKRPHTFEYLFLQLQKIDYTSLNRGSTQPLLTQTDLQSQWVILPAFEVLEHFSRFTCSIYGRIDADERESRTLAALRDALLPKLISGELRVKDAEKFLEERGL
jgi:type I restriction enzyme S subunit